MQEAPEVLNGDTKRWSVSHQSEPQLCNPTHLEDGLGPVQSCKQAVVRGRLSFEVERRARPVRLVLIVNLYNHDVKLKDVGSYLLTRLRQPKRPRA